MSTGNLKLDLLLNAVMKDIDSGGKDSLLKLKKYYPKLNDHEINEIFTLISSALLSDSANSCSLVATTPNITSIKIKTTKQAIQNLIENAEKSILITSYSMSDYFDEQIDSLIKKIKSGVYVRFFANQIDPHSGYDKLFKCRSNYLKIYNYVNTEDSMAALHAKVICVDGTKALITSANLSYHGQRGNIEIGSLIESAKIVGQITDLFDKLIDSNFFQDVRH